MKYIVTRSKNDFEVMERRTIGEVEVYEPVVSMPGKTAAEADKVCRALLLLDRAALNASLSPEPDGDGGDVQ